MTDAARPVLLRARGVGRRFGAVAALAGVDLELRAGEVHAIVGENGAGKSTLLRILGGADSPTEGAIDRGPGCEVALVHQELALAENLDVAGCIHLGREPSRRGFLDLRAMREGARRWLETVGLPIDPGTPCGSLPIAHRQLVEIAKALSTDARVLVLDEPTSSLSARETDRLLAILDRLRAGGTAVAFVSHHLDEVLRIADRVTVLRDGRVTGSLPRGGFDRATLERLMVGREIAPAAPRRVDPGAPVRLRARGVVSVHRAAQPVDLEVRAGEIVGIAGLVGAGRTELLEAIAGVAERAGRVELGDHPLERGAAARSRLGVAIVPEDRARHGIFHDDTVARNLTLRAIGRRGRRWRIDAAGEKADAAGAHAGMGIDPPDASVPARTLSGGNQQKAVIGRWMAIRPPVLLLDEPTRGVDVGSRARIHAAIRDLADGGTAVVFASSELEEVLMLADRVLVMHDGAVVGDMPVQAATEEGIMRLATGGRA